MLVYDVHIFCYFSIYWSDTSLLISLYSWQCVGARIHVHNNAKYLSLHPAIHVHPRGYLSRCAVES